MIFTLDDGDDDDGGVLIRSVNVCRINAFIS